MLALQRVKERKAIILREKVEFDYQNFVSLKEELKRGCVSSLETANAGCLLLLESSIELC